MRERGAPGLTACVILTRGEGEGFEVCWERRASDAAFLPGYHAFPGGRVERADADIIGLRGDEEERALRGDEEERALRGCAIRELCEEAGIALCEPRVRLAAGDSLMERLRAASQADPSQFGDFIYDHMLTLAPERLRALGRWTTPAWEPLRYETEFYQLHLSADEASAQEAAREALGWAGEWLGPGEALQRHARAEVFISGPTLALLEMLDAHRGSDAPRCDEPSQDTSPLLWAHHTGGVYILPLASPTLPPATHTNAYILGATRFVVVDPGADDAVELARLIAAIERLQREGGALEAIILTHHHTDHVSGLEGLARRFGALEVWAHAQTAALLAPGVVTRMLEDEEIVEVVDAGGQARRWRCLWTPGHAPGHLCLVEDVSGVGLVGDLIATVGTILVQPPTGHMGRYIESLERVRALGLRAVLPAHGGAVLDAHGKLSFYIGHRLAREAKVSAALEAAGGWASISELVPVAYADAPEHVWPLAAMSLSAHLERLEELGRAERDGARWRAAR